MIIMREYILDDWLKITDAVEPFMFLEPFDNFNEIVQRGLAVTAVENNVIMACGGVAYINDKEGVAWLKMSRKCLGQTYRWGRTVKETFSLITKSLGNMKVITYILKDFCKGEKLAKMIGMAKSDKTHEFNDNVYHRYMVVI